MLEKNEESKEETAVILRERLNPEPQDYLSEQENRRVELLEQIKKGEFERP
jgi:hypothetical protein